MSNKIICTLLSGVALACSTQAQSAGFYIQEQSVKGLGSAFAGSVTSLNDPSTIYFNPAGMTNLKGNQAQVGTHLLVPSSELTDTGSTENIALGGGAISGGDGGNPYEPSPVPNGYFSYQINERLWAGIGISAPFGLANEYDSDWFGRYDSVKTDLTVLDIQPTIAYKVNDKLSIGAGINIQHADAELTNAVSDIAEGTGSLKGDDWSYGYTLGLLYTPIESTTLGLSYRSAVKHTLDGTSSVSGTAVNDFSVDAQAGLHLPDIATLGIAHKLNPKVRLMGQATWFGWNNFEDITTVTNETINTTGGGGSINLAANDTISTITQNYQTTWAFAAGAEYDYSDKLTLRGGVQFDKTPTTDEYRTSRTPDGDRTWLSTGASYKINDKFDLDLAATYIWIDKEEINVTRNNSFSAVTATNVNADTDGNVAILAVGITYKF